MNIDYEAAGALSVLDFCRTYAVGRSRAYEILNAGLVEARKFDKKTLIDRASAEQWYQSLPTYQPVSPRKRRAP
jgi:hypothetical protein